MSIFGGTDPSVKLNKAAVSSLDFGGKRFAVVGGTDGLGRAIAKLLAAKGAAVTVVGRTFRDEGVKGISFLKADLSLMSEAKRVGNELPADLDGYVFTTGIMAKTVREVTAEGIEKDMAVSALSRYLILEELGPRLLGQPKARVWIMGFPGSGEKGVLGDLNSDVSYSGGMGQVHLNTVAANEALVHYWKDRGLAAYGLNPGLIRTGIRDNYHGGEGASWTGWLSEKLIGFFSISPERYAENVVPLLLAPELAAHKGAMFGQSGTPILPTKAFTDREWLDQWIKELGELAARAGDAKTNEL
ncbi:hypothetical protein DFJ74DRAFT_769025 [Hyaloraphidium curvatum]|nr:hypothetical protein DFJ74DRAFT_769025 [Hyaloraphidium curvatum]